MIRLTAFSLKQKSVVLLLAIGIFVAGAISWVNLKQELIPDVELPFVMVVTPMPGAGAEDVAVGVTEPIERGLANVPRLDTIRSTSSNSMSLVFAEFEFGTDVKAATDDVERAVRALRLPEGAAPIVNSFGIDDFPVVTATIGAAEGGDPDRIARIARHEILPEIQGITGVSAAELTGGSTPLLEIVLDPEAMAEHDISLQQVQGILFANRITLPSGSIDDGQLRLPVSTFHRYTSIRQLEDQIVGASVPAGAATDSEPPLDEPAAVEEEAPGLRLPSLRELTDALTAIPLPIRLGDIATIEQRDANLTGYARTDGQPSLTLTVSKASGVNTVTLSGAIEEVFDDVRATYAGAIIIETILDQADFITESVTGLLQKGLLGGLFAILVIFAFLRSVRTTLVAAISIPLSLFIAIATFGLFGLTINILTLSGLTVAVGRVVDDSIVVLENIYRHKALGEETGEAVISGTREVTSAITASTLTTVAVFLPIGFVGGIVSQFFLPFGLAVTFALLASLLVALTVIPVLAYLFVDRVPISFDKRGELPETTWQRLYTPVLQLALRSRTTKWGTLGIASALFMVAVLLAGALPTAFIDMGGENVVQVTISPPQGSSTAAVRQRTLAAEEILLANPDVELVVSTIAGESDTSAQALRSAFAGRLPNSGLITTRLAEGVDMDGAREAIKDDLAVLDRDGFDVAVAQQDAIGAGTGLAIVVSGQDPVEITSASDTITAALAEMEGIDNIASDAVAEAPQVSVAVDSNMAILIGSTAAQIGTEIRSVLVGQDIGTTTLEDGSVLDTTLRVSGDGIDSAESLRQMPISGMAGKRPLGQLADIEVVEVRGSVTRVDGSPAATVSADITVDDTGAVSAEAGRRIEALRAAGELPASVKTTFAGITAQMDEAFRSLFVSMAFAILVVYLVMVLALGSLITPFIILFSLPLAIIGAIPALLVTGNPLGISALIGLLMLIGIVVTNAIVLLDFVEQLRAKGASTHEALLGGGRVRVRPILMTAIATILALTPVAMGFAHGSVIAEELATVVIGGLFTSTFLTLIVVPVLYSLVDGGKVDFAKRFVGTAGGQAEAATAEALTSSEG